MSDYNNDLIVVLGPTATGKTGLAVDLAECLKGEIISADSRQVYRGMDLGTGKDLDEYLKNGRPVPHHLIDIVDAGSKYNVFEYQADFLKAYNNVRKNGSAAIMCGGTGMYIESVLKGYKLISVPVNENLRAELLPLTLEELRGKLSGMKTLHNTTEVDTHKRAVRAIEIESYYMDNPEVETDFPSFKPVIFGVHFEREIVRERITERLQQRLRDGMIDEVQGLLDSGITADDLIYYGLEYKFITQYLQKEFSYNKMREKLNIAIHQFSKRQMTWFRKMERSGFDIHWVDGTLSPEDKMEFCLAKLK